MTALEVIQDVYRQVGRHPFDTEIDDANIDSDSGVWDSPSGTFSLPNITEKLNAGQRAIAQTVKASHVPSLITSHSDATYTGGNLIQSDTLRALESRVFYNGNRCVQKSVNRYERLKDAGRAATSSYPVFLLEDRELLVRPTDGDTAKFYYIKTTTDASTPSASDFNSFQGGTDNSDVLDFPDYLKRAFVMYISSKLYQDLQISELQSFYWSLFQDELRPYSRLSRLSTLDNETDTE